MNAQTGKYKSSKHYVNFNASFILNSLNVFKYPFSSWVYVHLKFENYGNIIFHPESEIIINQRKISDFLNISEVAASRCVKELEKFKFIIRNENSRFFIIDEKTIIQNIKETDDMEESFLTSNAYIGIFYNFYRKVWDVLNGDSRPLRMYYYFKIKNRHYLRQESQIRMPSVLPIRLLKKELGLSQNIIYKCLRFLTGNEFIIIDQDNRIHTFSENKILKNWKKNVDPKI